jgi:hypothetical protein
MSSRVGFQSDWILAVLKSARLWVRNGCEPDRSAAQCSKRNELHRLTSVHCHHEFLFGLGLECNVVRRVHQNAVFRQLTLS